MNDDDFDFGFTAVEFDPTAVQAQVDTAQSKLEQVEALILPLLKNLMKNPEKEYIHWPNRQQVIQKHMEKILAVTRS